MKVKDVRVHLLHASEPVKMSGVRNTYQKGDLFCVEMAKDRSIRKFPLMHIFNVIEGPMVEVEDS